MLTSDLLLISVVVLALIACVVLGVIFYYAARGANEVSDKELHAPRLRADIVRDSFRQAIALIEAHMVPRGERYRLPWVMVLNEGEGPCAMPVDEEGALGEMGGSSPSTAQGISWHFFSHGIVMDVEAACFGHSGLIGQEKKWDDFLGQCRQYRPQRPFDAIIVAVPAAMLLATDAESRAELERRAELTRRRLLLAQRRFAMRFAVYVIVTDCEAIAGFREFSGALSNPLQASMLGWSSPYDLSMNYQSDWVAMAVRSIGTSISDASAELFAADLGALDVSGILLLPAHIQTMEEPLRWYIDGLLRPSPADEPLLFRGLYLTGGDEDIARRARDGNEAALVAPESMGQDGVPGTLLPRQPVFLRDLLERKIFLERGLTCPARDRHLARPVLQRSMHGVGLLLLALWGAGLIVATVQLGRHNAQLAAALEKLRADANIAVDRRDATFEGYRRAARDALVMDQGLRVASGWTVFIPGAWSLFDPLYARVQARFTSEFGQRVTTAVQWGLSMRAGQLARASLDAETGRLAGTGPCTDIKLDPDDEKPGSMDLDGQPALRELQRFVADADEFDAALQAFLSLSTSGDAQALRRVALYALDIQAVGDLTNSLGYFRQEPDSGAAVSFAASLRPAFRCAFEKASSALDLKLFVANPLLQSERAVARTQGALTTAAVNPDDTARTIALLRQLVSGINAQQEMLIAGKGGWMHQPVLNLGAEYDRIMMHAARNSLLGRDLVADVRARAQSAFLTFKAEYARLLSGADSGVAWSEKASRYVLTPSRQGLRDALSSLLGQSFMGPVRNAEPVAMDDGDSIAWDRGQLEQAVKLDDVRKRFLSDGLKGFPVALQPVIEQILRAQFSRRIFDLAVSAAVPTRVDQSSDSGGFSAVNSQMARIRTILADLGASQQADALGGLIAHDAMQRLRQVDQALQRAELYALRDNGMDARRVPTLTLFGLSDGAALGAYLEHQSGRALTLGARAATYLPALDFTGASSPLAQRWNMLNQDLERYRLQNPNSSLLRLEQFVRAAVNPASENCKMDLIPAEGGDYFATIQARLYDVLQGRCTLRYIADLRQQWDGFAATFNALVGGRAPFAGNVFGAGDRYASVGGVDAGSGVPVPVDFSQLGLAFKRYDGVSTAWRASNGDSGAALGAGAISRFIENFEQIHALLSPLYPSAEGARPGYDVNVAFRANRAAEVGANLLINWTLTIGEHSISLGDPPKTLYWNYGMPVTLTLRFAKDSPLIAANDPGQPALSIDGRSLTWQFTDPWALISLMQRQQATGSFPNGAGQLLSFEFPLAVVHAALLAHVPDLEQGRVFLRITLTPTGKSNPLPWPSSFPARAPDWSMQ